MGAFILHHNTDRFATPFLLAVLLLTVPGLPLVAQAHVGAHQEIESLSRQIREEPANPRLYIARGEASRRHGDWDAAIRDFSIAIEIEPGNLLATNGLGRAFQGKGDHQHAITYFSWVLDREPGNVRALALRAKSYQETGSFHAAAADYRYAIEQFDGRGKPLPDYYLGCARSLAAAGALYIDKALHCLDDGIAELGNIRSLELYAVELENSRGNVEAALARINRTIERTPHSASLLMQRGDLLAAAGRRHAAEQDYHAAREAIEKLSPQRRHASMLMQLEAELDARLASQE
jgi:tetratricopeptide (TPR) repeat protein